MVFGLVWVRAVGDVRAVRDVGLMQLTRAQRATLTAASPPTPTRAKRARPTRAPASHPYQVLTLSMKKFLLAMAVAVAACRDSTPPPVPTTIVLSSSTLTLDALGAGQSVTATVKDQHGAPMSGVQITWTSSTPT